MKIYKFILRVPGGMMVVPLFIGMVINTFFPNLLKIGGFTQALTGVGYPTILGMYLFTVSRHEDSSRNCFQDTAAWLRYHGGQSRYCDGSCTCCSPSFWG